MTAEVAMDQRGEVCVATFVGEVDLAVTGEAREAVLSGLPAEAALLVVDLSAVEFLDSSGIRLLFELRNRLRTRRQELRLVVPHDSFVLDVLTLTRVPESVPVYPTLDEAVASRGSAPAA